MLLCNDTFGGGLDEFLNETRKKLQYLHGKQRLSDDPRVTTSKEDTQAFLLNCSDEHFLDFVEYIFNTELSWHVGLAGC